MDSVADITRALVQIPSVNPGHEPESAGSGAMFDWLEQWGRIHGFDVERHRFSGSLENLTIRLDNRGRDERGKHLLFSGHVDTVATGGMTIPPFSGELKEGRILGRGSCDMKGPIASMLVAAVRLKEQRSEWQGEITLGFTPDEETGTEGVRALMNQIARPDFAVVGEPSCLKPLRGCKGGLRLRLHCAGLAAHSSKPTQGRSAVVAMAHAIVELDRYFRSVLGEIERPQFGRSTGSIGLVMGGTAVNIVPDRCSIDIDIRLVPGQDPTETYDRLRDWFDREFPDKGGISWKWEEQITYSAYEVAPEHELVGAACEVTGERDVDVAHFCCDASTIAAADVPSVILGPGDIAQAHTVDEFVEVEQLERGVDIYVALAKRLLPPIDRN